MRLEPIKDRIRSGAGKETRNQQRNRGRGRSRGLQSHGGDGSGQGGLEFPTQPEKQIRVGRLELLA